MKTLLSRYQGFHGLNSLMDVGGGIETTVAEIVRSLQTGGIKPFYTTKRHENPRITIDPPDLEINHIDRGLDKVYPSDLKQIFIRSVEGRHHCV